jgi:hypothetical protein
MHASFGSYHFSAKLLDTCTAEGIRSKRNIPEVTRARFFVEWIESVERQHFTPLTSI